MAVNHRHPFGGCSRVITSGNEELVVTSLEAQVEFKGKRKSKD